MNDEIDEEYDSEAWGNNKTARAEKYKAKKRKKARPDDGPRLRATGKKNRTKVPMLKNYEDYDDYEWPD